MLSNTEDSQTRRDTQGRVAALEERIELLQHLYELATAVNSAKNLDDVFNKALQAMRRILGAHRAAILLFDEDGVMRFKAWAGLSDGYRRAVEGHSPWTRGTRNPAPVMVRDVDQEPSLNSLRTAILGEGIRSLCFFPLTYQGQLLGKFMVYYDEPYVPGASEVQISQIISYHVASGVGRKLAAEERERLLEMEQTSRRLAEEANRIKDEFLAVLSHELRTPLASTLAWVRLLREGGLDEATMSRALEIIERNTNVQSRLIEDLLDVTRIVAGTLKLEPHAVDLRTVIEATCEAFRPSVDAKGVVLEVDLPHAPQVVSGDTARLQQVFWNLLTNAIKSTPRGGTIRIEVRRSGQDVEARVSDTGRGIGADFMPFVFERFRQADGGSRRMQSGLGLGLAIVHDLVELHYGRVTVESEGRGKGATFSVRLPHAGSDLHVGAQPAAAPPGTAALPKFPSLDGLKVLLVEDETDVRDVLAILLQRCGASVMKAASAREALAIYASDQPDILVTDIGMPLEDGYDLLSQVRSLRTPVGRHAPAIALTGYARGEDRSRAMAAGFQMHLVKPVDPVELAKAVRSLAHDQAFTGREVAHDRQEHGSAQPS